MTFRMTGKLKIRLDDFVSRHAFTGKGPLCVALVVTDYARSKGLPLSADDLVTQGSRGGGQVRGLGKTKVQSILQRHEILRVLAAEGGRTSRGSLNNMRAYVNFLNGLESDNSADLIAIEAYWIDRVRAFFAAKPFRIKLDASRGLRHLVRDILDQANLRQKDLPGVHYVGAVLQHLVGAKLDCALGAGVCNHNSFSTADAPRDRIGDFSVGEVSIHVTTAPGEAVIERCRENLNDGYMPVIITLQRGVIVAAGLAENRGLEERIDIFEIEQFIASNLYEAGEFRAKGWKDAINCLIDDYNAIIESVETDPSLRIEIRK